LGLGDRSVVELLRSQHGAGLEVVSEAQRVANFMHCDMFDCLTDELPGQIVLGPGPTPLLRSRRIAARVATVIAGPTALVEFGRVEVGQGNRRQAEVILQARLELTHPARPLSDVSGKLPLERALIGGDDFGDHPAGRVAECAEAEEAVAPELA